MTTADRSAPKSALVAAQLERLVSQQGYGRNQVARALNVSPGTVTSVAKVLGISFTTAPTAEATAAAVQRTADRRALLAEQFGQAAEEFLRRALATTDASDARQLMIVAGIASDKLVALERHSTDRLAEERREARYAEEEAWTTGAAPGNNSSSDLAQQERELETKLAALRQEWVDEAAAMRAEILAVDPSLAAELDAIDAGVLDPDSIPRPALEAGTDEETEMETKP